MERDRLTRAAAAYEALLAVDPTHYWGANNLMFTYQRLGRYDRAAPLAVQLARERPNDARLQTLAAVALTAWRGDLEAAAGFVRRARELRDAGAPILAEARAWVDLFDAHVAWVGGDIETARAIVDHIAARLASMNDGLDVYALRVGHMYLGLGRCRDARKAFERIRSAYRHETLAMASLDCDDVQGFERHLLEDVGAGEQQPSYTRVMFGARTRRLADAATWIDDFERRFANPVTPIVGRGELAAARKEWATALRYFEEAWEVLRFRGEDRSPRVAVQMANAYAAQGRTDRALEVLELTVAMRARVYDASPPGAMAWIRAQIALARLHRTIGREADAVAREDLVRMLLRDADRDLSLVQQLEAR